MLPAAAKKYAERELRRRLENCGPRKGVRWYWAILAGVPLLLLSAVLLYCAFALPHTGALGSVAVRWFCGGFAAGGVIFSIWRLPGIYVFGHELTHWLAAKCLFHKTGRLQLSWRSGRIEVPEPNTAIILAPYCLPIYFILSAGLTAFITLVWPAAPQLFQLAAAVWLGLCYSYHIVLTIVALTRAQEDLTYCGIPLSWALILFCNLLFFYVVMVFVSGQWQAGWRLPISCISDTARGIISWSKLCCAS